MIMWNFCWREPSRMTLLVAPIFMLPFFLVGHWEVWLGSRQLGLFCNEKCQVLRLLQRYSRNGLEFKKSSELIKCLKLNLPIMTKSIFRVPGRYLPVLLPGAEECPLGCHQETGQLDLSISTRWRSRWRKGIVLLSICSQSPNNSYYN